MNNRRFWAKGIKWMIAPPLTILIVIFSISNKQTIEIFFWPLPWALEVPVYLFSLSVLVSGFLFGYVVGWGRAIFRYYIKTKEHSKSLHSNN
jgi:uncharacterized integral membrane protein|tara:strand:- start:244 stop:519 length:276 start_codon:yes stop_codon:yes gene_type:complete